jgi:hypothetical protein
MVPEYLARQLHKVIDAAVMFPLLNYRREVHGTIKLLFESLNRHRSRYTRVYQFSKRCFRHWETVAAMYAGEDDIKLIMKEDVVKDALSETEFRHLYDRTE